MTRFEALFADEDVEFSGRRRRVVGDYMLGRTIGEGTFAKVKKAVHSPTGERVRT